MGSLIKSAMTLLPNKVTFASLVPGLGFEHTYLGDTIQSTLSVFRHGLSTVGEAVEGLGVGGKGLSPSCPSLTYQPHQLLSQGVSFSRRERLKLRPWNRFPKRAALSVHSQEAGACCAAGLV